MLPIIGKKMISQIHLLCVPFRMQWIAQMA